MRLSESSRAKDLVDILLFACMDIELRADRLYATIQYSVEHVLALGI